jgi:hypothetical protein
MLTAPCLPADQNGAHVMLLACNDASIRPQWAWEETMADNKAHAMTLAARGARVLCADPRIHQLTPAQLNALHLCKYEMLAAMCRAYAVVPQKEADEIIAEYLGKILGGGNGGGSGGPDR